MTSQFLKVPSIQTIAVYILTSIVLDLEPPTDQRPIAKLAHGLDRVLFKYERILLDSFIYEVILMVNLILP
jgi:hypothetical protein